MKSRLGFLYYLYRENTWWYEGVELSRKLVLNCLVALITPGENSQVVFGLFCCLLYLVFLLMARPYKTTSDLRLAASTHASLFITLLCGLLINMRAHYLGEYTFPDPVEREEYEMFGVELIVISHVVFVFIQFLIGVLSDMTCNREILFLKDLERNKDLILKQAISQIEKDFVIAENTHKSTSAWSSDEIDMDELFNKFVDGVVGDDDTHEDLHTSLMGMSTHEKVPLLEVKEKTSPRVPTAAALKSLFRDYDMDGNGHIEIQELATMIFEMHQISITSGAVSQEESKRDAKFVMSELDKDGNGTLETEEFVKWIQNGSRRSKTQRDMTAKQSDEKARLEHFLSVVEDISHEIDLTSDLSLSPAATTK